MSHVWRSDEEIIITRSYEKYIKQLIQKARSY
jgi:hypothetical protein